MWKPQVDVLKKLFYIICYDTRGHGESTAPKGPYTLAQLGQDVIHLMGSSLHSNGIICGISMGGLTGQWLAIHHPERLIMLIV